MMILSENTVNNYTVLFFCVIFCSYIKASLDFIRTMVRFYGKDLETMKNAKVSNLQKSQ